MYLVVHDSVEGQEQEHDYLEDMASVDRELLDNWKWIFHSEEGKAEEDGQSLNDGELDDQVDENGGPRGSSVASSALSSNILVRQGTH